MIVRQDVSLIGDEESAAADFLVARLAEECLLTRYGSDDRHNGGTNLLTWTSSAYGSTWPSTTGADLVTSIWLVFYGADGQAIVEPAPSTPCPNPPTVTIREVHDSEGNGGSGVDRVSMSVALTMVVATQLWHHTFLSEDLADLPTWHAPDVRR